jgi:cysteine desulfurase
MDSPVVNFESDGTQVTQIVKKCTEEGRIKTRIYADNNASTMMYSNVNTIMLTTMHTFYANPSAQHADGRIARCLLERMRQLLGRMIGAPAGSNIIFTSGGSESNNLVIRNVMDRQGSTSPKIIFASALEHDSVLNAARYFQNRMDASGKADFTTLVKVPATPAGYIDLEMLRQLCLEYRSQLALVCVMLAQNEIGTIQPINAVVEVVRQTCPSALILVDATQAIGKYNITIKKLGYPDFVTATAHKFHGPHGIGFVYAQSNLLAAYSQISGGAQESSLRAGTENLPAIVGMVRALEISIGSSQVLAARQKRVREMRDYILNKLTESLGRDLTVLGDPCHGLYNTLSITISRPSASRLARKLDETGISVSAASACTQTRTSHVLAALGLTPEQAKQTIRISLSEFNTLSECQQIVRTILQIVALPVVGTQKSETTVSGLRVCRQTKIQSSQSPIEQTLSPLSSSTFTPAGAKNYSGFNGGPVTGDLRQFSNPADQMAYYFGPF